MIRDKPRYLPHASLSFEKVLESYRSVEDLIQLFDIGDAFGFGEGKELLFHDLMWNQQRVRRQAVEKRQRRAVLDALGNRVLVEIAFVILTAERFKGSPAIDSLVDGRARQADVG